LNETKQNIKLVICVHHYEIKSSFFFIIWKVNNMFK